jgi:biopolymer transport protein ExbB/TolQ
MKAYLIILLVSWISIALSLRIVFAQKRKIEKFESTIHEWKKRNSNLRDNLYAIRDFCQESRKIDKKTKEKIKEVAEGEKKPSVPLRDIHCNRFSK